MILSTRENKLVQTLFEDCFVEKKHAVNLFGNASSEKVLAFKKKITAKHDLEVDWIRDECARDNILPDVLLEIANQMNGYERAIRLAWHLSSRYDIRSDEFLAQLNECTAKLTVVECAPSSLEGLISESPFLDINGLQEWASRTKSVVCKISCDGEEKGSGFLVSQDLVLTCFHVIESHISEKLRGKIKVLFDFFESGTVNHTNWKSVDASWDIPFSRYSQEDLRDVDGNPEIDFLDFALLKLSEPTDAFRKPFILEDSSILPKADNPILIAGHPGPVELQKMKFTMAAPGFEKACANGTRFVYKASTERGSSGSPVFDSEFKLIGMHHNRGQIIPDKKNKYKNNRGIPILLIAQQLHDKLNSKKKMIQNLPVNVNLELIPTWLPNVFQEIFGNPNRSYVLKHDIDSDLTLLSCITDCVVMSEAAPIESIKCESSFFMSVLDKRAHGLKKQKIKTRKVKVMINLDKHLEWKNSPALKEKQHTFEVSKLTPTFHERVLPLNAPGISKVICKAKDECFFEVSIV